MIFQKNQHNLHQHNLHQHNPHQHNLHQHNPHQHNPQQTRLQPTSYSFCWFDWFCLWYPPGWLILFNRHWQHYHLDPEGWNGFEYGLFLIPGGFYLALLCRWLRLGCRPPRSLPAQLDSDYQTAFCQEILLPILKHYFRAELHNLEHLPEQGSLIIAMNHAGMCFPWDMVGLGVLLGQVRSWQVQPLAHPIFFDHPWLRWWLPSGWSQVLGGVRAERSSFTAAICHQTQTSALLYAPESWRGLVKGWTQRYQLQTFDPSFVRLSHQYQVPILPVVCLGNERLHPWAINIKPLTRWLKLPIVPLSIFIPLFLLFPSMGVWANRTRLHYSIQPLERPESAASQCSHRQVYQRAQAIRSHMQQVIDRH